MISTIFIHISLTMLSKSLRPLTHFFPTYPTLSQLYRPTPYLYLPSYSFKLSKNERLRKQLPTTASQSYIGKRSTYLNLALICFVFAVCFAGIPLYRTFCEHMGLVGDFDKKTYDFKGKKMMNQKKYKIIFEGIAQPGIDWEFEPIEKELIVNASETAIVFYRLYNREEKAIIGFASYNIYPEDVNVYFSKIQCFCFNQQMINPKEQLLLPLFFYLEPEINDDDCVSRITEIKLTYNFIRSANQELAKFAQEETKKVEENKKKLRQIRAKKEGISLEEYERKLELEEQKKNAQLYGQPEREQIKQDVPIKLSNPQPLELAKPLPAKRSEAAV